MTQGTSTPPFIESAPSAEAPTEAETAPFEGVIEPVMLAELRSMRDILPELIVVFRSEVRVRLDAMRTAIESGDAEQLRQLAHGIRGAAGNMGGRSLAAVCNVLEQRGRDGTLEGAIDLLPEVETLFTQLCAALEYEEAQAEE